MRLFIWQASDLLNLLAEGYDALGKRMCRKNGPNKTGKKNNAQHFPYSINLETTVICGIVAAAQRKGHKCKQKKALLLLS